MSFGAHFIPSRNTFGQQDGDAYSGSRSQRSAGLCAMKVVL
jgi:hypothetical protein